MREEHFTYDKNLNISRNQILVNEARQRQQHGRVASREYKVWRHTTSRINPNTGMPEEGKSKFLAIGGLSGGLDK
jgi:hypothetical protein